MKISYDSRKPDLDAARRILFAWLRADQSASQLSMAGEVYEHLVDWVGPKNPQQLAFHISEVFWQLLVEGVIAPGANSSNMNLPWFHLTEHGRQVVMGDAAHAHDPDAYLARLRARVVPPDDTVLAYVAEGVATFRHGTMIASAVMIGIAAERVFLLVCDAMHASLADPSEKARFEKILGRFAMKPKLDWIHAKLTALQSRRLPGFPEGSLLMVTAIYELLRVQRNDLGHPREAPPRLDREDVFASLQIFPRYYETANQLIQFLRSNPV